jgi:hypothetical protein
MLNKIQFNNQIQQYIISPDGEIFISYIIFVFILVLIILVIYYIVTIIGLETSECKNMDKLYPNLLGSIHSINTNDAKNSGKLLNYYIKTAYNACSGGSYKNDFVDICNLKSILKEGVRCLDFALYSIQDSPVVATSTTNSYYVKETFNYVAFADVMKTIKDYAFTTGTAPNSKDPIILHLRLQSNNRKMYSTLTQILQGYDNIMLGKEYSYESNGNNLGESSLVSFMGKIILIIDKNDKSVLAHDELLEYINLTSNSSYMRVYRYSDFKNNSDTNELINFNKYGMTIILPDEHTNPSNPDPDLCRESGCQMVAMRYQYNDAYLKKDTIFFNDCGQAFCNKPGDLVDPSKS